MLSVSNNCLCTELTHKEIKKIKITNNPNLFIAKCCQSATTTFTRAYKHIRKYTKKNHE